MFAVKPILDINVRFTNQIIATQHVPVKHLYAHHIVKGNCRIELETSKKPENNFTPQ